MSKPSRKAIKVNLDNLKLESYLYAVQYQKRIGLQLNQTTVVALSLMDAIQYVADELGEVVKAEKLGLVQILSADATDVITAEDSE